jgi:hypothetical protein
MRNRRYTLRKGPLVIFGDNNNISKAFRNLPGVEVASVNSLNLLQVCVYVMCVCDCPMVKTKVFLACE